MNHAHRTGYVRSLMDNPAPLSAERQKLLAQRLKGVAAGARAPRRLPRRAEGEPVPLSTAQHQVWVVDQMNPGNPAFNVPAAYRLGGKLNLAALEEALNAIVRRHEILRTTFREADSGDAVQKIRPEHKIGLALTPFDHLPAAERESAVRTAVSEEAVRSFDLTRLPLIRVALFRLAPEEHVLLVNFHHIVADGVSFHLLFGELDILYRAALTRTDPRLPEPAIQYADFAAWQKAELEKPIYAPQFEYWRRQLEGELPLLEFAPGKPPPHRQSFAGSNVEISLPQPLVKDLTALSKSENCTFFVAILTALQVILSRYSQAEEIVFGTPIANRAIPEVHQSIGNFVNMVALRCHRLGAPSFAELLRCNQQVALDALTNKDIPFEMLVKDLKAHRQPGHSPVFQVLLQVLPPDRARLGELSVTPFAFETRATQVDLALHLYEQVDGGVQGCFQFCTALFSRETIAALARNFAQLLEQICQNPNRQIQEFPIPALPVSAGDDGGERTPASPPTLDEPAPAYAPPQNSVHSHLIEIWEEVLLRKPIGIRDNFFDLGGHSLLAARIVALVSERLGHRLSFSEFFSEPTIEKHALSLTGPQSPARQTHFVTINPAGAKTPVFFFHGDFVGGGFFCKTLASVIGADRPFHALHPHGLQGDEVPLTIEAMAVNRVNLIRELQPHGPYILGGYCNGAFVAYQAARILRAFGEEVSVLLMLYADGANARYHWLKRFTNLSSLFHGDDEAAALRRFLRARDREDMARYYLRAVVDLLKRPSREKAAPFLRRAGRLLGARRAEANRHAVQEPEVIPRGPLSNAYGEAFHGFVPERYDAPMVLLWPREEKPGDGRASKAGWERLCHQTELVEVPGNHHSCISQHSNVLLVGEAMRQAIAQAEGSLNQNLP